MTTESTDESVKHDTEGLVTYRLVGHADMSADQCPRCGTGKIHTQIFETGVNAGKLFMGCKRFPRCRYFNWVH